VLLIVRFGLTESAFRRLRELCLAPLGSQDEVTEDNNRLPMPDSFSDTAP